MARLAMVREQAALDALAKLEAWAHDDDDGAGGWRYEDARRTVRDILADAAHQAIADEAKGPDPLMCHCGKRPAMHVIGGLVEGAHCLECCLSSCPVGDMMPNNIQDLAFDKRRAEHIEQSARKVSEHIRLIPIDGRVICCAHEDLAGYVERLRRDLEAGTEN